MARAHQIRGEQARAEERGALGAGARAHRRQAGREVGRGKVRVGRKVNHDDIDDELGGQPKPILTAVTHLSDLHGGEVPLPPDLAAGHRRRGKVYAVSGIEPCRRTVVVHEDVDGQVEGDRDPGDRGAAVELRVAERRSGRVVEDVQELQRLLLDDEEQSVEELPVCAVRRPCDERAHI